jgi:hypothetical protein
MSQPRATIPQLKIAPRPPHTQDRVTLQQWSLDADANQSVGLLAVQADRSCRRCGPETGKTFLPRRLIPGSNLRVLTGDGRGRRCDDVDGASNPQRVEEWWKVGGTGLRSSHARGPERDCRGRVTWIQLVSACYGGCVVSAVVPCCGDAGAGGYSTIQDESHDGIPGSNLRVLMRAGAAAPV